MLYFIVVCCLLTVCSGKTIPTSITGVLKDNSRVKREPQTVEQINYRPIHESPVNIKQLFQIQHAREPLVHISGYAPSQLQTAASLHGVATPLAQIQPLRPEARALQADFQSQQQNPQLSQHLKNQQYVYQQKILQAQLAQISRPLKDLYKNLYYKLKNPQMTGLHDPSTIQYSYNRLTKAYKL